MLISLLSFFMFGACMEFDQFYDEIESFTKLPGVIDALTVEAFERVQKSKQANQQKNIVYIWRTQNKFPRFNGESDILYIGQTKQSFAQRYSNHSKWIGTEANRLKYQHAIKYYGGITISVCDFRKFGETLKDAEGLLLWWYFKHHYEYPPINYTKTSIRRNEYER